jgi:DNA-binding SARP family transcriptional activator
VCRLDLDALEEVIGEIDALFVVEADVASAATTPTAVVLAARVLDVYRGPFMDGDSQPEYTALRERVRNRVLGALDQLARICESDGEPQQALAFFRRAIEQDPLAEAFHRRLMLMLRDLGHTAEAIDAYARCKSLIETERGDQPSPETQAIYEAVRRDL